MNQRFVWNFEFSPAENALPAEFLIEQEADSLKWESRFFWPAEQIIVLHPLDNSLLDMANYQKKHREDCYYLLANTHYNVKRRRNELLYKPECKKSASATGFSAKINLDSLPVDATDSESLQQLKQQITQTGIAIAVTKEAFIYKFSGKPLIKLELARLKIMDTIYFTACIEGKSLERVEAIAKRLLGEQVSCDYVTFLNKLVIP